MPDTKTWFDSEVFFVWCLVDRKFREIHSFRCEDINLEQVNWEKVLLYTRNSPTLLYKFSREALEIGRGHIDNITLQIMKSVVSRGDQNLKRLRRTLMAIKDLWDGRVKYYIIKTRDDRPTGDVDILFTDESDYESAITIACHAGYRFIREEPFKGWIAVKDGVKIELHHGISWFGMKALDKDFVGTDPRRVKLMNFVFPTINERAELALELSHWILDIQTLGSVGFSNLISIVEKDCEWGEIIHQAEKYGWTKQLAYHLSVLNELCKHVYSYELQLPIKLPKVLIRPCFPVWTPIHIKVPFMVRKILRDNNGLVQRMNMLQLALRRYAWARMRSLSCWRN